MNLGKAPWQGLPDDPHTACGCYPPKEKNVEMRNPSPAEKVKAITDTVKPVADYLMKIGKIEAFNDFTKDEVCGLIRVAQEGVQQSLHEQMKSSFDDEIPF